MIVFHSNFNKNHISYIFDVLKDFEGLEWNGKNILPTLQKRMGKVCLRLKNSRNTEKNTANGLDRTRRCKRHKGFAKEEEDVCVVIRL